MSDKELIKLGFKDVSYTYDGTEFREFTKDNICISGINFVEIKLNEVWSHVPNCKNVDDLKELIRLFCIS